MIARRFNKLMALNTKYAILVALIAGVFVLPPLSPFTSVQASSIKATTEQEARQSWNSILNDEARSREQIKQDKNLKQRRAYQIQVFKALSSRLRLLIQRWRETPQLKNTTLTQVASY